MKHSPKTTKKGLQTKKHICAKKICPHSTTTSEHSLSELDKQNLFKTIEEWHIPSPSTDHNTPGEITPQLSIFEDLYTLLS